MARHPRAIFFGTPAFAVPSLDALANVADIKLVVTQPDKPAGRGMRLTAPPVKIRAEQLGLPLTQPRSIRSDDFASKLRELHSDIAVVVAYGKILPATILCVPRCGCVNVHASLLPRWRGAAPLTWAIANGDFETGVTLMKMDEGMDTGPILSVRRTSIDENETAGELGERLSRLGGRIILEDLIRYVSGDITETLQNSAVATYAPLLKKADGRIRWDQHAMVIHNHIRAMTPWPGAFSFWNDQFLKVHRAVVQSSIMTNTVPGTILSVGDDGIEVAAHDGTVGLLELQLKGGKRLAAAEFLRGHPIRVGDCLGYNVTYEDLHQNGR